MWIKVINSLYIIFHIILKVSDWQQAKACMPVIKPLWALIIPVFTIPGCTALIVTLAFLSCIFKTKTNTKEEEKKGQFNL